MLIQIQCPQCGGVSQIEAGRGAICPYCGNPLPVKNPAAGEQMQAMPAPAAQQVPQAVPFPQMQQVPQAVLFPQMQQAQQVSPEQRETARHRRANWRWAVLAGMLMQAGVLAMIVPAEHGYFSRNTPAIIWMMLCAVLPAVAAAMRPDSAYTDKPPFPKSKVLLGFLLFIAMTAGSFITGALFGAAISGFF